MPIDCTPTELADLSRCFMCLTMPQREAVKTYLLAVIAGGSTDPETLLDAAKCYVCLTPKQLRMLQPYLMCLIANGVTPPTPGECTYQDMMVDWEPTNLSLGEMVAFSVGTQSYAVPNGITSITLRQQTMAESIFVQSRSSLVTFSAPNLTALNNDSGVDIEYNPVMTSVSIPLLSSTTGSLIFSNNDVLTSVNLESLVSTFGFFCESNPLLTSISLPSLQSNTYITQIKLNASLVSISIPELISSVDIAIENNALLTTIGLDSWVPANGDTYSFQGNALNAATVNALLARCVANAGFVSGSINTSGGTSATPTGQGVTDKNILNARQAGLAITN